MTSKLQKPIPAPTLIRITGLILSESYQYCKYLVTRLRGHYGERFEVPTIKGMLEVDWNEYLDKLRKKIGGQTWAMTKGVVVFIDDVFVGGEDQLFERFSDYVFRKPKRDEIKKLAKKDYEAFLDRNNNLYTYMDISMDDEYIGTLMFELRPDLLPRSATRFALLCDKENHTGISYKGSRIHRVCRNGWFQAGELSTHMGCLADESYCYKHDKGGTLSFANDGTRNTNGAQFFVTFRPSPWMDGRYVAFGRVVEGSKVLRRIEYTECSYESPESDLVISDCGLIQHGYGKRMCTKLRLKALTVGEPHLYLETFMDLVFDQFCEVLFNRLDEGVKREFHSEWIGKLLWNKVSQRLKVLAPEDDTLDVKDQSSALYLSTKYLAGLYGLHDVPDHYIKRLLNELVQEAADRSDTVGMAREIVTAILESRELKEAIEMEISSDTMAEDIIDSLLDRVNLIIFGPEVTSLQDHDSCSHLTDALVTVRVRESLADLQKRVGKIGEEDEEVLSEGLSMKESVVGFIWNMLLDQLKVNSKDI